MIKIKDPRQTELFDSFAELLGHAAYRRMKEGWQGCFRKCIFKCKKKMTLQRITTALGLKDRKSLHQCY